MRASMWTMDEGQVLCYISEPHGIRRGSQHGRFSPEALQAAPYPLSNIEQQDMYYRYPFVVYIRAANLVWIRAGEWGIYLGWEYEVFIGIDIEICDMGTTSVS